MRTMYDSVTVSAIPKTATLAAGYVDGRYANVTALRKRLPNARIVTITVLGAAGADVCDCESGDLTPPHAAAWAEREHAAGRKPTIYCLASQLGVVKREVAKVGLTGKVSYWVANYDGKPLVPAGCVAKQYADPKVHGKGNFDLSAVADYWPGVDPAPAKKTPARKPVKKPVAKKAPQPKPTTPPIAPVFPKKGITVSHYKKAIVAVIGAVGTWALAALPDGAVTADEWAALGVAVLTALGVYQAKNAKK